VAKSSEAEKARRVNATINLLKQRTSASRILSEIVARYGLSRRQAYRYLQQAQKSRFSFACSRPESGLHGQTSSNFNHAGPPAGWAAALFDQCLGGARPALGAGAVQIPWLNPEASENCVAKFTLCLIVMCSRRCLKFIVGWCPSRRPGEAGRRLD